MGINSNTLITATDVEIKNKISHSDILSSISNSSQLAWKKITPCWPLKSLIAVNPLQGLEDLPFEEALATSAIYFQQKQLPLAMTAINRETIKWCQAFFDEGQAVISMPFRHLGLYQAWRKLAPHEAILNSTTHRNWLRALPDNPEQAIADALNLLTIDSKQITEFFTLMLTTLPGWSSYVKYQTDYNRESSCRTYPALCMDYLAVRIVMAAILWPQASDLLSMQITKNNNTWSQTTTKIIREKEERYYSVLLKSLSQQAATHLNSEQTYAAQFVFCIDVRSEPFRRALEAQGPYETFGFAGFFGLPIKIQNEFSEKTYASCPVLLQPAHQIKEKIIASQSELLKNQKGRNTIRLLKFFYQSLKYTFTTPFVLVEILGPWSGMWTLLQTILPRKAQQWKEALISFIQPTLSTQPCLSESDETYSIPFLAQCAYAENALRIMNLTHFSPIVVFCAHRAETQNNAYNSALDCGACGGNPGEGNARVLATILNNSAVRTELASRGIIIPSQTHFIAAQHNTTTDEIVFYTNPMANLSHLSLSSQLEKIKKDLVTARKLNNFWRAKRMTDANHIHSPESTSCIRYHQTKSKDWAQTRPEWGLARNAAFIIGPRDLTKNLDLDGRCFLHSYQWEKDPEGTLLTNILTAPLIVAQWINSQYLFSSLDNIAYGSGSKITHNITGKFGIMQGNGSDLMQGLPLQSVFKNDQELYHEPLRLIAIVHAPKNLVNQIISHQPILEKLFKHGWIHLACIEPNTNEVYNLQRNLTWQLQSFTENKT